MYETECSVTKVLFLCIGNSIRSQMAEAFARKYGSDVLEAASAGFTPASIVQPLTKKVMEAKNISLETHFPKDLEHVPLSGFDLIVNISGRKLPTHLPIEVREWTVEDPMGKSEEEFVVARDLIENLVMRLVLDLRKSKRPPRPAVVRPATVRRQRSS
jgi:arsenate reductase